jgi:hypothetical protein
MKRASDLADFCTFAGDSAYPKRKTFSKMKTEKFSKTENFSQEECQ